jgi:hypothetical protein
MESSRCYSTYYSWFKKKNNGPGQEVRAGSGGKSLEHGSSIPSGNFPIISGQFLPERTRNWQESTGKIRTISRWNL